MVYIFFKLCAIVVANRSLTTVLPLQVEAVTEITHLMAELPARPSTLNVVTSVDSALPLRNPASPYAN